MGNTVSVNGKSVGSFLRKLGQSPGRVRAVEENVLNTLAFETRAEALSIIESRMTMRSPGFVTSVLNVTKATRHSRMSIVGSIGKPRFTGWVEQETATPSKKDQWPTIAARGGSKSNRVLTKYHMSKAVLSKADRFSNFRNRYSSESAHRKAYFGYTRRVYASGEPFLYARSPSAKPHMFAWINGVFTLLNYSKQYTTPPPELKWLDLARNQVMASASYDRMVANSIATLFPNI